MNIQVGEAVEAQYVPVEDEEQLTEAPVAALQDNGKSSISGITLLDKHKQTPLSFLATCN